MADLHVRLHVKSNVAKLPEVLTGKLVEEISEEGVAKVLVALFEQLA